MLAEMFMNHAGVIVSCMLAGAMVLAAWARESSTVPGRGASATATQPATMPLASTAFTNGQPIPKKYTADGENISPPLSFTAVPEAAKQLALIMDDPDAPIGTWDHWILYGIPAGTKELKEGLSAQRKNVHPSDMVEGKNSWRHNGYEGPEPPAGKPHRYYFRLYALDAPLDLKAGASKKELLEAMNGHVIAQGELMGMYKRP